MECTQTFVSSCKLTNSWCQNWNDTFEIGIYAIFHENCSKLKRSHDARSQNHLKWSNLFRKLYLWNNIFLIYTQGGFIGKLNSKPYFYIKKNTSFLQCCHDTCCCCVDVMLSPHHHVWLLLEHPGWRFLNMLLALIDYTGLSLTNASTCSHMEEVWWEMLKRCKCSRPFLS